MISTPASTDGSAIGYRSSPCSSTVTPCPTAGELHRTAPLSARTAYARCTGAHCATVRFATGQNATATPATATTIATTSASTEWLPASSPIAITAPPPAAIPCVAVM